MRAPLSAPRLRWSAPEIRRLGKKCGAVVDALEAAGGELELGELAAALNVSRPRDLRRRYITRLEAAAVVECSGDTVALAADWLEALNREREAAGELAAARRDMRHYADEQRAYANRRKNRSDPHPANVGADGFIEDLEPAPEIPDSYTLTGLIGTRVDTPRGPGILLDHKGNEARVILDADQSRWIPVPLDRVDFERGEIAA